MQVRDQERYDEHITANNDDPYGRGILDFAHRWAGDMESQIREGARLEDIAKLSSHDADTEGITGFMYGCAVGFLAECWEHGERLRRWSNTDVQIGDEGDRANETPGSVLNPAVVAIAAPAAEDK